MSLAMAVVVGLWITTGWNGLADWAATLENILSSALELVSSLLCPAHCPLPQRLKPIYSAAFAAGLEGLLHPAMAHIHAEKIAWPCDIIRVIFAVR
jgi:hypothetical protein